MWPQPDSSLHRLDDAWNMKLGLSAHCIMWQSVTSSGRTSATAGLSSGPCCFMPTTRLKAEDTGAVQDEQCEESILNSIIPFMVLHRPAPRCRSAGQTNCIQVFRAVRPHLKRWFRKFFMIAILHGRCRSINSLHCALQEGHMLYGKQLMNAIR